MRSMPRISMVPILLREALGARTLPRECEPALVMDEPEQVASYVEAGRIDGVMSAAYLFHTGRMSQVLQGCARVIDLGCGPATQLIQLAEYNPDISFTGLDLSPTMLAQAEAYARARNVTNVQFQRADITRLDGIDAGSIDGVISTMALHHLPTVAHLESTFAEIRRVLRPDGAVYLVDFGRLKSLKSVIYFAYLNAKRQPHLFTLDYERSLRASFLAEEFESLGRSHLPPSVEIHKTFVVPMLVLIKTSDRPLPPHLRSRLGAMREALPPRYRRDLDEIRLFFRLGGLANDPFA